MVVVLPAPFGPRMAKISPRSPKATRHRRRRSGRRSYADAKPRLLARPHLAPRSCSQSSSTHPCPLRAEPRPYDEGPGLGQSTGGPGAAGPPRQSSRRRGGARRSRRSRVLSGRVADRVRGTDLCHGKGVTASTPEALVDPPEAPAAVHPLGVTERPDDVVIVACLGTARHPCRLLATRVGLAGPGRAGRV